MKTDNVILIWTFNGDYIMAHPYISEEWFNKNVKSKVEE